MLLKCSSHRSYNRTDQVSRSVQQKPASLTSIQRVADYWRSCRLSLALPDPLSPSPHVRRPSSIAADSAMAVTTKNIFSWCLVAPCQTAPPTGCRASYTVAVRKIPIITCTNLLLLPLPPTSSASRAAGLVAPNCGWRHANHCRLMCTGNGEYPNIAYMPWIYSRFTRAKHSCFVYSTVGGQKQQNRPR